MRKFRHSVTVNNAGKVVQDPPKLSFDGWLEQLKATIQPTPEEAQFIDSTVRGLLPRWYVWLLNQTKSRLLANFMKIQVRWEIPRGLPTIASYRTIVIEKDGKTVAEFGWAQKRRQVLGGKPVDFEVI